MARNLVADTIREGSGLHAGSRFGAEAFSGSLAFTDNTTVRTATLELNWDIGLGAIWFYALDRSIDDVAITVSGDHYLDNTYAAMMFVTDWPKKDQLRIDGVSVDGVRVDGAGTNVISARTAGSMSLNDVDVRNIGHWGVNNCGAFNWDWANGSEFSLADQGGNDGVDNNEFHPGTPWLAPYVPNLITCSDRPPVVPPPPPSPWQQP